MGEDLTIRELAGLIQDAVGFRDQIRYDLLKPRRDSSKAVGHFAAEESSAGLQKLHSATVLNEPIGGTAQTPRTKNMQRTIATYNVHAIRAVLTESSSPDRLPQALSPVLVYLSRDVHRSRASGQQRPVPRYLEQPEWIFKRIWASPMDETLLNLAD